MRSFRMNGKQLSEYLHIDPTLVSKWKNGYRKPSNEYLNEIALLFVDLMRVTNIKGYKN